jgi:hypothetical protein
MRILVIGLPFVLAVVAFTVVARGQWLGTTPILYGVFMVALMLIAGAVSNAMRRRLYPDRPLCPCDPAAEAPITDPSNCAAGARQ